jgi:hypothetical protein
MTSSFVFIAVEEACFVKLQTTDDKAGTFSDVHDLICCAKTKNIDRKITRSSAEKQIFISKLHGIQLTRSSSLGKVGSLKIH